MDLLEEMAAGNVEAVPPAEVICYGRTVTRHSVQEVYETEARHAGPRARELRRLGYRVHCDAMGVQVTNVGRVKLTLVTVLHDGENIPPPPARVERGL